MKRFGGWAVATALALAACATSTATKQHGAPILGESQGRTLALHVGGFVDAAHATVRLKLENHTDQPVGVDLDAVRLVDEDGDEHPPLGRSQSFRDEDGNTEVRRVRHGAATLPPSGHMTVELEFQDLPSSKTLTLAVPKVYSIGIDGQEDLPGVRLPLRVDTENAVADQNAPQGWFDPFEKW